MPSLFPLRSGNQRIGHWKATHHLLHPFKYRKRCGEPVRLANTSAHRRSANLLSTNIVNRKLSEAPEPEFRFKKALIVTKLSRYEFEQHRNPKLTHIELEQMLRNRGTDYDALIDIHKAHKEFEARVANSFKQYGIDVKLSNR